MSRRKWKKKSRKKSRRGRHRSRAPKGVSPKHVDPASLPVSTGTQNSICDALACARAGEAGAEARLRLLVTQLIQRRLSTGAVGYLEELYDRLPSVELRTMVAKRAHQLRHEYLASYKEFSDRALIQLSRRDQLLEKWEGIYLLGYFGGSDAQRYLTRCLRNGLDAPLKQAAETAIVKIERRRQAKLRERGF